MQDKLIGISFRRRDQLKPDLVWEGFSRVILSNVRFGLTDILEVNLDHVRMPAGNGREKTKGRSLNVLYTIRISIFVVKAACCVWVLYQLLLWPELMVTQSTHYIDMANV